MTAVLTVKDLVTRFYTRDGVVHAVNGVGFHLDAIDLCIDVPQGRML